MILSAKIWNRGLDVGNIPVSLYRGDPHNGGILLENKVLNQLVPLHSTVTIDFTINTAGFNNVNDLFVVIDPDNIIDELSKSNNIAVKLLKVNRGLVVEAGTDTTQYQSGSEVGINVHIENNDLAPWTGTGDVYIEDLSGNQVAHVAAFSIDAIKPVGIAGWAYRIPAPITANWDMKDTLAQVTVDFSGVLAILGLPGNIVDTNSLRVLEVDSAWHVIGEKQAKADFGSAVAAKITWLVDGLTLKDTTRYFYIYFDISDNGVKDPPQTASFPRIGNLLAFSDDMGRISLIVKDVNGTYKAPVVIDTIAPSTHYHYVQGIGMDDFNSDGFADIVTGTGSNGAVYYYRNKADGTNSFYPRVQIGSIAGSAYITDVALADFNNDGKKDFVISAGRSYFFKGNADGTFVQSSASLPALPCCPTPMGKSAADVDGDGNMDLVVATISYIADGIYLYKGKGDGTFMPPVKVGSAGYLLNGLVLGDFDEDGRIDIIVNNGYDIAGYPTYFLKGNGNGTFGAPTLIPSLSTYSSTAFDTGDFNNDGHLDVIAATKYNQTIEIYPGKGDGTFGIKTVIAKNTDYPLSISASPALPELHPALSTPESVPSQSFNFIWNTDSTAPANYKVHVTLSEGQAVVAEDSTPFEILPDVSLGSKVVTEKVAYKVNETATITSTVTSQSQNTILENLTAKIAIRSQQSGNSLDSPIESGNDEYTETKTIPILPPGQLIELKTYWNTSTNPKGIYTVTLEVSDGSTVLGTSQATFEILGTSDTGEGLIGTITAQPNPVDQGRDETITYSVTNKGNEDIGNLEVKVLIVDPESQAIKAAFSYQRPAMKGESITGTQTVSTIDLSAKTYLAVLQARTAAMIDPKTLASATFEVKPGLEITKTIPDMKRVLVWLNYQCINNGQQSAISGQQNPPAPTLPLIPSPQERGNSSVDLQDCVNRTLTEQALKDAEVTYHIVLEKKDFETELRNPLYTDFLILGDFNPIEDHYSEELREHVYAGKGFISSLFNRQNLDGDLFGIKFNGQLAGSDHPIELLESMGVWPYAPTTFQSKGRSQKVDALNPAEVVGWIIDTPKYPGIMKRRYGEGKALYYAFDLGLSSSNYEQFALLLKNSLSYIHKPMTAPEEGSPYVFSPNRLIPVELTVKSLGGAFDLRITETYPAEMKLYDPPTATWITDNPWVTETHLDPEETKTVLYHALSADEIGAHALKTEVGYMDDGTYNFYKELSVEIAVDKTAAQTASDILSALNALSVSGQDKARVSNTVRYINDVQERVIVTNNDVEKNIEDILKAIDSLLAITSADTAAVRLMMDNLLEVWEASEYLDDF